ncbi:formate dehydrogenase [Usitatibacter palustris]|uniref:Formate dehydrogenase region TAT target n=1 Tax=Usitatibacter palustris TaxID=2732487 RepID=A0A6M4H7J2_9PROT|nr:formate dehydrogenase [Usitatibacter palustris]QJR15576.1 hypothetical protein DSM104440_02398 [Usitatibacter palustris]
MKTAKPNARRNFLLAASAGTAGVAAAVVTGRKAASPGALDAPEQKARGYHVSAHIEKYYRTTES